MRRGRVITLLLCSGLMRCVWNRRSSRLGFSSTLPPVFFHPFFSSLIFLSLARFFVQGLSLLLPLAVFRCWFRRVHALFAFLFFFYLSFLLNLPFFCAVFDLTVFFSFCLVNGHPILALGDVIHTAGFVCLFSTEQVISQCNNLSVDIVNTKTNSS